MRGIGRLVWPLITGMSIIAGPFATASWINAQAGSAKAEEEIKPLIVMIRAQFADGENFGAGIILGVGNDRLYIVTANHVIRKGPQEAQKVQIQFKWLPGEQIEANLLDSYDANLDLGVLAVVDLKKLALSRGVLRFDKLAEAGSLKREDSVYSLGNPDGHPWQINVAPDKVASRSGDRIVFESAFIRPGHSGGALLNERRELVGLITEAETVSGKAVSIQSALESVRQWGYRVNLKPPEGGGGVQPPSPGGRPGPEIPPCRINGVVFIDRSTSSGQEYEAVVNIDQFGPALDGQDVTIMVDLMAGDVYLREGRRETSAKAGLIGVPMNVHVRDASGGGLTGDLREQARNAAVFVLRGRLSKTGKKDLACRAEFPARFQ